MLFVRRPIDIRQQQEEDSEGGRVQDKEDKIGGGLQSLEMFLCCKLLRSNDLT